MAGRPYPDEEKAAALALLAAHGGNLSTAAKAVGCARRTLKRWRDDSDVAMSQIAHQKKAELEELFKAEIIAAFGSMADKRGAASYRDVATAVGIFFDKLRLMGEQSTEIHDHRHQDITPAEAREGLTILKGGKRAS